jgi:lipoate-protein ligase A
MAADESLLCAAAAGSATLRFYGWSEPAVSLGYFQKEAVRDGDPLLQTLPYVRRPTGGATLVHHHEVTYALALPAGAPWQTGENWLVRMHRILALALDRLGVQCVLHREKETPRSGPLCFRSFTPGDLIVGDSKIAGSAQRRQRRALLQHGAVLLAQSHFTPGLAGIRELCGTEVQIPTLCTAAVEAFQMETGWTLAADYWSASEQERITELVAAKYSQEWWNQKR